MEQGPPPLEGQVSIHQVRRKQLRDLKKQCKRALLQQYGLEEEHHTLLFRLFDNELFPDPQTVREQVLSYNGNQLLKYGVGLGKFQLVNQLALRLQFRQSVFGFLKFVLQGLPVCKEEWFQPLLNIYEGQYLREEAQDCQGDLSFDPQSWRYRFLVAHRQKFGQLRSLSHFYSSIQFQALLLRVCKEGDLGGITGNELDLLLKYSSSTLVFNKIGESQIHLVIDQQSQFFGSVCDHLNILVPKVRSESLFRQLLDLALSRRPAFFRKFDIFQLMHCQLFDSIDLPSFTRDLQNRHIRYCKKSLLMKVTRRAPERYFSCKSIFAGVHLNSKQARLFCFKMLKSGFGHTALSHLCKLDSTSQSWFIEELNCLPERVKLQLSAADQICKIKEQIGKQRGRIYSKALAKMRKISVSPDDYSTEEAAEVMRTLESNKYMFKHSFLSCFVSGIRLNSSSGMAAELSGQFAEVDCSKMLFKFIPDPQLTFEEHLQLLKRSIVVRSRRVGLVDQDVREVFFREDKPIEQLAKAADKYLSEFKMILEQVHKNKYLRMNILKSALQHNSLGVADYYFELHKGEHMDELQSQMLRTRVTLQNSRFLLRNMKVELNNTKYREAVVRSRMDRREEMLQAALALGDQWSRLFYEFNNLRLFELCRVLIQAVYAVLDVNELVVQQPWHMAPLLQSQEFRTYLVRKAPVNKQIFWHHVVLRAKTGPIQPFCELISFYFGHQVYLENYNLHRLARAHFGENVSRNQLYSLSVVPWAIKTKFKVEPEQFDWPFLLEDCLLMKEKGLNDITQVQVELWKKRVNQSLRQPRYSPSQVVSIISRLKPDSNKLNQILKDLPSNLALDSQVALLIAENLQTHPQLYPNAVTAIQNHGTLFCGFMPCPAPSNFKYSYLSSLKLHKYSPQFSKAYLTGLLNSSELAEFALRRYGKAPSSAITYDLLRAGHQTARFAELEIGRLTRLLAKEQLRSQQSQTLQAATKKGFQERDLLVMHLRLSESELLKELKDSQVKQFKSRLLDSQPNMQKLLGLNEKRLRSRLKITGQELAVLPFLFEMVVGLRLRDVLQQLYFQVPGLKENVKQKLKPLKALILQLRFDLAYMIVARVGLRKRKFWERPSCRVPQHFQPYFALLRHYLKTLKASSDCKKAQLLHCWLSSAFRSTEYSKDMQRHFRRLSLFECGSKYDLTLEQYAALMAQEPDPYWTCLVPMGQVVDQELRLLAKLPRRSHDFQENLQRSVLQSSDERLFPVQLFILRQDDFVIQKLFLNSCYYNCKGWTTAMGCNERIMLLCLDDQDYSGLFSRFVRGADTEIMGQLLRQTVKDGVQKLSNSIVQTLEHSERNSSLLMSIAKQLRSTEKLFERHGLPFSEPVTPQTKDVLAEAVGHYWQTYLTKIKWDEPLMQQYLCESVCEFYSNSKLVFALASTVQFLSALSKHLFNLRRRSKELQVELAFDRCPQSYSPVGRDHIAVHISSIVQAGFLRFQIDIQEIVINVEPEMSLPFAVAYPSREHNLLDQHFATLRFEGIPQLEEQILAQHKIRQCLRPVRPNYNRDEVSTLCILNEIAAKEHLLNSNFSEAEVKFPESVVIRREEQELDLQSVIREHEERFRDRLAGRELGFEGRWGDISLTREGPVGKLLVLNRLLQIKEEYQSQLKFMFQRSLNILIFSLAKVLGCSGLAESVNALRRVYEAGLKSVIMSKLAVLTCFSGFKHLDLFLGFKGEGEQFSSFQYVVMQKNLIVVLVLSRQ